MVVAAALLPLALLGLVFLLTWMRIASAARARCQAEGDVIVILGAKAFPTRPSAELGARIDHAAELWRAGVAPRLVCSGGWDGEICEPVVMAEALIGLGVPATSVEVDDRGHSTSATIAAAADYARAGSERIVLVSSPYHLCRLRLEAQRAGLPASVSAPASTPITRNRVAHALQRTREAIAIWRSWLSRAGRRGPAAQPTALAVRGLTGVQAWRT